MKKEHRRIIEKAYQLFSTCPNPGKRKGEEQWSIKEILGHLIDSAGNNHQRLSRYKPNENLDFPGYEQERFVARAAYDDLDYDTLLALWLNYNKLLMHMISRIPEAHRGSTITVGDRPRLTLDQLIDGYMDHMALHLAQVAEIVSA